MQIEFSNTTSEIVNNSNNVFYDYTTSRAAFELYNADESEKANVANNFPEVDPNFQLKSEQFFNQIKSEHDNKSSLLNNENLYIRLIDGEVHPEHHPMLESNFIQVHKDEDTSNLSSNIAKFIRVPRHEAILNENFTNLTTNSQSPVLMENKYEYDKANNIVFDSWIMRHHTEEEINEIINFNIENGPPGPGMLFSNTLLQWTRVDIENLDDFINVPPINTANTSN
jgi:hypothetical protein